MSERLRDLESCLAADIAPKNLDVCSEAADLIDELVETIRLLLADIDTCGRDNDAAYIAYARKILAKTNGETTEDG
jgi:hypothetical protein